MLREQFDAGLVGPTDDETIQKKCLIRHRVAWSPEKQRRILPQRAAD